MFGDKTYQYHPRGLPSADFVPTLAGLDDPESKFSCASHHNAAIDNHASWVALYRGRRSIVSPHSNLKRTAVFISNCQTAAGSFLSCLPGTAHQPTELARFAFRWKFQRQFRIRLAP